VPPNARGEPRLEAAARHARRRLSVGSSAGCGGMLSLSSYATRLALRDLPARAVAEFNKRKRLSAPGLAHEMPEMVEFTPRVAAIISARYAHTAKRAGLAGWCQRYPEPVQDGKDVFAVQRHQGDAPG
jgi:hypothetical protein